MQMGERHEDEGAVKKKIWKYILAAGNTLWSYYLISQLDLFFRHFRTLNILLSFFILNCMFLFLFFAVAKSLARKETTNKCFYYFFLFFPHCFVFAFGKTSKNKKIGGKKKMFNVRPHRALFRYSMIDLCFVIHNSLFVC